MIQRKVQSGSINQTVDYIPYKYSISSISRKKCFVCGEKLVCS